MTFSYLIELINDNFEFNKYSDRLMTANETAVIFLL